MQRQPEIIIQVLVEVFKDVAIFPCDTVTVLRHDELTLVEPHQGVLDVFAVNCLLYTSDAADE